jgi:hypothetical protein
VIAAPPSSTTPPYRAQWESHELIPRFLSGELSASEDPHWARSGARTPAEYEFWSWRGCGVACLQSLLDEWYGSSPGMVTLAHELLLAGGYTLRPGGVRGLVYAPFAEYLLQRWDIKATVRAELPLSELAAELTGGTRAMVSVHPEIRAAPQPPPDRGGHLVLAYRCEDGHLEFHNPSGDSEATRAAVRLPPQIFEQYYAGRGVLITE